MDAQSRSYSMVRQMAQLALEPNHITDQSTAADSPPTQAAPPTQLDPAHPEGSAGRVDDGADVSPLLKAHLRRRSRAPPDAPPDSSDDDSDADGAWVWCIAGVHCCCAWACGTVWLVCRWFHGEYLFAFMHCVSIGLWGGGYWCAWTAPLSMCIYTCFEECAWV